jgi:hypothetical protein
MSQSATRSPVRALGGAQHRGSAGTSYRDNVDVQRQMQQDIDSAMSMCEYTSSGRDTVARVKVPLGLCLV